MADPVSLPTTLRRSAAGRWLLLVSVGSGCAALIYEVVWFQLLELSIGSSAVSLAMLLGVFMGGLCLGSLLFPRCVSAARHPLFVYALIELGIGVLGIVALFAVPATGRLYSSIAGSIAGTGQINLVLRAAAACVCLLPPTVLMGATLPAIARWAGTTSRGVSWLAYFYAGNLAGAVAGALAAGFYLLPVYDLPTTTAIAVALNVLVALLALWVAARAPHAPIIEGNTTSRPHAADGARLVYVAIALSGLTALGAQVVWTRVLSLLFGATVYAFSLILAAFLVGLGIGTSLGSALARSTNRPRFALGGCQLGICAALAWAAYITNSSMPYWPINPSMSASPAFTFQLDLMRALWVMMPGAILWGMSFPLALAAIAEREENSARLVGGVYAANTIGAIVGALVTSLVLISTVGSRAAQQIFIGVAALAALLMFLPPVDAMHRRRMSTLCVFAGIALGAGLLARTVPPLSGPLVAYGRYAAASVDRGKILYVGEGLTTAVAVSRTSAGALHYHNAGKVQASSEPQDVRLQRMLGHLTTLVPVEPARVLVIGYGAGVTAGAVSIDPLVKEQTIAEIEPLVPRVVSTYFAEHNFDVLNNENVSVRFDDGRHYLLTTHEKFDAITSDPLDPWVKGAANLYTREFFDLLSDHLNPNGVVTLFVQLYESNEAAVKSAIGTFFEAFPNGAAFANTVNGQGYDLVLLGRVGDRKIDVDAVQKRLEDPSNAAVAQSLREIGILSAVDLFGTYAGSGVDLEKWLRGAAINTDRDLKLQYLAGLSLNIYRNDAIYRSMLRHVTYPEHLFEGSPKTLAALRGHIQRR
jgi:spermidine synthase